MKHMGMETARVEYDATNQATREPYRSLGFRKQDETLCYRFRGAPVHPPFDWGVTMRRPQSMSAIEMKNIGAAEYSTTLIVAS